MRPLVFSKYHYKDYLFYDADFTANLDIVLLDLAAIGTAMPDVSTVRERCCVCMLAIWVFD